MMMHGAFKIFLSLALGYAVCVAAKKQEGLLKTVGYAIGIGILVLSLAWGALFADMKCRMIYKEGGIGEMMSKMCPMMSKSSPAMKK